MTQSAIFGLSRVASTIQVGKKGPWIVSLGNSMQVQTPDQSSLTNLQVAAPVGSDDAAPKSYVDASISTSISTAITNDQLVSLTQWSRGGSTSIVLPPSNAANGTVGSSGWFRDPSGQIRNWAYIQLGLNTNVTWSFPVAFPTGMIGFHAVNVGGLANNLSVTSPPILTAVSASSVAIMVYNSGFFFYPSSGPFYVEATGY